MEYVSDASQCFGFADQRKVWKNVGFAVELIGSAVRVIIPAHTAFFLWRKGAYWDNSWIS